MKSDVVKDFAEIFYKSSQEDFERAVDVGFVGIQFIRRSAPVRPASGRSNKGL